MKTVRYRQSRAFRITSLFTVAGQVLLCGGELRAATNDETPRSQAAPKPAEPAVKINRTVPKVQPPPALPAFSEAPTDDEIFRARVFEEPLVPIGKGAPAEDKALADAIAAYLTRGSSQEVATFDGFLARYPQSAWRAALLTDLGIVYRRSGYFTKALAAWEEAWRLLRAETEPRAKAMGDRAVSELAELNARLGRFERLEPLFAEIEGRGISGAATEKIAGAKQGLWLMQNRPGEAFRCGPMALDRILAYGRAEYRRDKKLTDAQSTSKGMSLVQVRDLANSLGMKMRMAQRSPGASLPIPALVHWKAGHYAAAVAANDGRYLIQDPTFGDEIWVTQAALDEEGSGFALVREGPLPEGWREVSERQGTSIWGKGNTTGPNPQFTGNGQVNAPGAGACKGMAQYSVNAMAINLRFSDSPVGYSPAVGPAIDFRIQYNHRDAFQPQIFTYGNAGPKWTFDWMTYVTDNPSNPLAAATVYLRGGGEETDTDFNAASSSYAVQTRSRTLLVRTRSNPVRYERRLPDGSVEVFAQPDGATTFPRKVFLTSWTDAQGNAVTLTYDAQLRLVAATDALGQVTTLSYELPSDPLKITRVTDPFGRSAALAYDESGRLQKITDVLGMESSFTYGAADFIASLTTPYGTTSFAMGESGIDRWIEITDPLGGMERVEYNNLNASVPGTEAVAPIGFTNNQYLNYRNTFFWDKQAMALFPRDYTKARIFHWLHTVDMNETSGVLESEKLPLEGRVWYSYTGQARPYDMGTNIQPTKVARVLDDGTTQLLQYEYNTRGMRGREIDPVGRETVFVYGTNNVPDPDPVNGAGLDLLQVKVKNLASPSGWDVTSTYTYNAAHQPLTSTDAAGQTTTTMYDAQGRLETVTTPPRAGITEERTTTYSYDPVTGNVASVSGPGGVTTSSTYDAQGRLRTTTSSDGYTLTYDYDALDRPTRVTFPDSTYEETTYEGLDPVQRRDRLGRLAHTFYDPLRRVVSTRDPAGRTVTQQWCACGSLEKLIDANGNPTTWERDLQGRVTREERANGSSKRFTYETTTSRLKQVRDAKLQEIHYAYGLDDKLLQTTYVNAEHPTPSVTHSYTDPATGSPDAHGRLRQTVDGTGTTTYAYHPFGQLGAGQLASVDGPLANDTIAYGYGELGRVVSRALNGVTSTWAYDALGRLTTQGDPIGNFTYSYAGSTGRVSTVTYPNGQTSSYAYGPVAQDLRLQEINHRRPGGTTLNKFDYTYDALGNILTWAQQTDGNPAQTYTFEYDRADQLTAATLAAPTPKRYRYAYDPAGNRTGEQINDLATAATYDTMNRLTAQTAGGPLAFRGTLSEPASVTVGGALAGVSGGTQFSGSATVPPGTSQVIVEATDANGNLRTNTYEVAQSGGGRSFAYDANGDLISDGTKTYEWDAANRLLAVEQDASMLASFTYDGNGRRSTRAVGGVTTTYVYDGQQFLEERSGAGSPKRYIYGPGIDRPLAQVSGGTTSYNVADHLGSIVRTTTDAGTPTLTRDYDPWGNLLQGATNRGYAYTGREWESEVGFYYYRARYYRPDLARFVSEDPLNTPGRLERYLYALNNPLSRRDPSGAYTIAESARPYENDIDDAMRLIKFLLPRQKDRCCLKYFESRHGNPMNWADRDLAGPPEVRAEHIARGMGYTYAPFTFLALDIDKLLTHPDLLGCACASAVLHEFGHFVGKKKGDRFLKDCTFDCLNPVGDDDY